MNVRFKVVDTLDSLKSNNYFNGDLVYSKESKTLYMYPNNDFVRLSTEDAYDCHEMNESFISTNSSKVMSLYESLYNKRKFISK